MQRLKGVAVTDGATAGRAVLLTHRGQAVRFPVPPEQVEREVERLQQSRDRSRVQLEGITARISHGLGSELAPLFEAQLLILDDPMLLGRALTLIREERVNAEWAVHRAFEEIEQVFDAIEDPYLRERKGDVEDVVGRLRMNLRQGSVAAHTLLRHIEGPFVLVADELSPSMAAQIDWTRVRGFAMDAGSRTYHTAILARSLQIPAIVGLHDATTRVRAGDMVVIDGATGELIVDPTPDVLRAALARHDQPDTAPAAVALLEGPATTQDGVRIRIEANVDLPDDTAVARGYGADGHRAVPVRGPARRGPGRRRQRGSAVPRPTGRSSKGWRRSRSRSARSISTSTARSGGSPLARSSAGPPNAATPLGLRGLRLSLSRSAAFKQQLRAMLRARRPRPVARAAAIRLERRRGARRPRPASRSGPGARRRPPGGASAGRRDDRDAGGGTHRRPAGARGRLPRDRHQRPDPVHARRRSHGRAGGPSVSAAAPGASCGCCASCAAPRHGRVSRCRCAGRWRPTRRCSPCSSGWA